MHPWLALQTWCAHLMLLPLVLTRLHGCCSLLWGLPCALASGAAGGIPAQRALRIWGDLHVVRTLTSTASFTIMLWGLASSTV